MIRHIVLWRLKSADEESVATIRSAWQAQLGRIPGLLSVEVGRSFNTGYHGHPAHMETRAIVDPLVAEHWIADYEV